ncbi:hypothetical protein HSE2_gp023 [Escherichia phage vB_EcoS_HSE2]|nr:hypothetical protein HSE2_gp023 [Escherichia phage vB_EcoS_HSE2]
MINPRPAISRSPVMPNHWAARGAPNTAQVKPVAIKQKPSMGPEITDLCCLSPITPPASAAARSQPVTVSVNLSKMNPPGAY